MSVRKLAQVIKLFKRYLLSVPSKIRIFLLILNGCRIDRSCIIEKNCEFLRIGGGEIILGARTKVSTGAIFRTHGGNISLGSDCSINPYCVVYGHGGLSIGHGVRIATGCTLIPSNHIFSDPDKPIFKQGEKSEGIKIHDDCWIGANVVVLDGVNIASGCVIGAGSVVTKNTAPFGIYAGNPAKILGTREDIKELNRASRGKQPGF